MNRKRKSLHIPLLVIAVVSCLCLTGWALDWLDFGRPWWLSAWLAAPLFVWLSNRSAAGLPPRANRWSTTLRVIVWLLVVAALADLYGVVRSRRLAVYFVVDRSASIPESIQQRSLDYVDAALQTKGAKDLAGLVVFGKHPSIETLPSTELDIRRVSSLVSPDYTNLESAVELAVSAFPSNCRKKIVLITDGNENAGSVMKAAEFAAAKDVTVSILPVQYEIRHEVWVQDLRLPETVREGEPFEVRGRVHSTYAGTAELELYRNDRLVMAPQTVQLQAGRNDFDFTVKIKEPGYFIYRLRVRAARDTVAANNSAAGSTRIRGRSKVLFVTADGTPSGVRNLVEICEQHAIQTAVREPALVPTTLARLQNYDCLVLADVPATEFSESQLELIRTSVRDSGLGLIMIGGNSSFGAGAWRDTPVEAALPVNMEIKHREVRRQSALILVLDCSGSMSGEKLKQAKPAATAAVEALHPADVVGIVAFSSQPHWQLRPEPVANRSRINQAIGKLASGGGTNIVAAVREAHTVLAGLTVPLRHMIVLSDGQSHDSGLDDLMRRIRDDRITVSTIGIGERDGQPLMQEIAQRGGGRFHYVSDPRVLPQVFLRDVNTIKRNPVSNQAFQPLIGTPSELIKDVRQDTMPALGGYVLTSAKERARVSLTADAETRDPVLAQWRYGLGKAVAFTSDAGPNWAAAWLEWPPYRQLWERILLWTTRPRKASNVRVRTRRKGDAVELTVDAVDATGRLMAFDQIVGRRIGPDHKTQRLDLRQVSHGRYQARFQAEDPGFNLIHLAYTDTATGAGDFVQTGIYVPQSPEYRQLQTNTALLQRLARKADPQGTLLPRAPLQADIFQSDRPPDRSRQAVWELLLLLALLLFCVDVVLRRVVITSDDLQQAWASAASVLTRQSEGEHDETLVALRERKQQVFGSSRQDGGNRTADGQRESFQSRLRQEAAQTVSAPPRVAEETASVPRATSTSVPPVEAEEEEVTYTNRLLRAKQRAQEEQD